ncbi:16S rRNA (adenine(1518)-N(6)/adenine(1519)-N(6))-dimethyltransferase RsmA [Adlercreutzia caecimuris]|uniref:Ribosomal RNA small subunit methyltransferase A n=1 Tax=Adlercreutzia caecimuris B7 TaxID=1235794 RepID=R9L4F8_9ACTN|nr:16S rRNA (adenine(1518)-N(6)/adenine(1519)-N(6))-dimethyltransferase RsmA [Adlercreutzia caecimuris]EOS53709.1 dimethyladenosine transferase [Adlercreutzia caecimuris B7]
MAGAASYADDGRLSPLSTPSATRAVLEAHGIGTKYTLGQNFLVNDDVLKRIIALAEVGERDRILEVGPGIGTLTIALLKHAASVVAVERDPDLPAVLADTLYPWRERFALIEKDALNLTAADIGEPPPSKFVSNLPYAVAATVVLDYFQQFPFLESATIMVQKEVADRMAAERGTKNYGAYTVKLGLYAEVAGRFAVGPGNFFPPPRVDSAVIRLNRRVPRMADGAPAAPEVIAAACLMADAAFANRRKTLANSCKTYFAGRGTFALPDGRLLEGAPVVGLLPTLFAAASVDPRRRGETLDQQEFLALGQALLANAAEQARP